ncbi:unnamed protein product, partial [Amoebophrya sp. A120]
QRHESRAGGTPLLTRSQGPPVGRCEREPPAGREPPARRGWDQLRTVMALSGIVGTFPAKVLRSCETPPLAFQTEAVLRREGVSSMRGLFFCVESLTPRSGASERSWAGAGARRPEGPSC